MNAKQQLATALIAVLMLATILMMPPRFADSRHPAASLIRQAGSITPVPGPAAELPREPVREGTHR